MKTRGSLWTCVSHPKTKLPSQNCIMDAPDARERSAPPHLRGSSQLYVNAAICRAAAPLPFGPQLGCPFGLRKVSGANGQEIPSSHIQGWLPHSRMNGGAPRALQKPLSIPVPQQGKPARSRCSDPLVIITHSMPSAEQSPVDGLNFLFCPRIKILILRG